MFPLQLYFHFERKAERKLLDSEQEWRQWREIMSETDTGGNVDANVGASLRPQIASASASEEELELCLSAQTDFNSKLTMSKHVETSGKSRLHDLKATKNTILLIAL